MTDRGKLGDESIRCISGSKTSTMMCKLKPKVYVGIRAPDNGRIKLETGQLSTCHLAPSRK